MNTTYTPGDTVRVVTTDSVVGHMLPLGTIATVVEDDTGFLAPARAAGVDAYRVMADINGEPLYQFVVLSDIEPVEDEPVEKCPCGCDLDLSFITEAENAAYEALNLNSPASTTEPDPIGSTLYITGDTAHAAHHFPVGTEVVVVDIEKEDPLPGMSLQVAEPHDPEFVQWVFEADLDVERPDTGPFSIGEQVRLFNGDLVIVVDHKHAPLLGVPMDVYTVVNENRAYPIGCSDKPGCATFPADFMTATDEPGVPPYIVESIVEGRRKDTFGETDSPF